MPTSTASPSMRILCFLKSLSRFVSDVLLPHESVQHVKTAVVLEHSRPTPAFPSSLGMLPGGADPVFFLAAASLLVTGADNEASHPDH